MSHILNKFPYTQEYITDFCLGMNLEKRTVKGLYDICGAVGKTTCTEQMSFKHLRSGEASFSAAFRHALTSGHLLRGCENANVWVSCSGTDISYNFSCQPQKGLSEPTWEYSWCNSWKKNHLTQKIQLSQVEKEEP